MEATQALKSIPLGTPLIYYNKWTGFETDEFQGKFQVLTKEEIKQLKPGQVLYVDMDPLHRNGKVYGRVKVTFVKLEPVGKNEFRVYYDAGKSFSGYKTTKDGVSIDIEKTLDENAILDVVNRLPKSTVIDED